MNHSLAFLILLVAVSLCDSNRLLCQIFDSSERFLQHYCESFTGILPENCSSNINSVIDSPQVHQLKIGGCDPEIVLDSVKRFQRNLRALDISFSGYENLYWFALKLDKLRIFNASHNNLSRFSWNFFTEFSEIVEIDLSYNSLSSTNYGLRKLPKLQKLHLSHNSFTDANMENLPLQSLDYLDLSSNQIEFLLGWQAIYTQYKNLKELHLEQNPFSNVDNSILEGMFFGRLTSLFLTWRNVTSFRVLSLDECPAKRMRIVRIDDQNEGIFLTSNGTYEIHCSYKCFENVYFFHAGYNNFQNGNDVIQNMGSRVYRINLSGNFIGELSASAFDRFTKMDRLELSETNLTWFDFDMLRSQRDAITHVDISNNNLKDLLNIPSLQNYKLEKLIMGGNQIENAYEIIEHLNPSITNLDLSGGNFVGKLNYTTFQRLIELKQLNLSNTNLVLPNLNPFEMLQDLKVLDLSHNSFEDFNFSVLSATLYNLTELRLSDCRIKDIAAFGTVIQYLGPSLLSLDLSQNAVRGTIDSSNFDLDLLKHQRKLTSLNIANNQLKSVDFKLFSFPADQCVQINLEGNDLIELTNLHKRNYRWLRATLKLANNQFPCAYLKQLRKDYEDEIYFSAETWQQKPDRDCRTSTESIKGFMANVYDTIKFW